MPSLLTEGVKDALESYDLLFVEGAHQAALLSDWINQNAFEGRCLGVDTETTGLDPRSNRVRLVQVATKENVLIVDLDGFRRDGLRQVDWSAPGLQTLYELLEGPRPKVLQNAAFDLNFLRGEGVVLGGPIFDTMIAAKVINNGSGAKNDLGAITDRAFRLKLPKELQKADWSADISEEMLAYGARDALCLPWLAEYLSRSLRSIRVNSHLLWQVFELEMRVLRPIALMQWYGFGFDTEGAVELKRTLSEKSEALKHLFLGHIDEAIRRRHPDDPSIWLPREEDDPTRFNTREKETGSKRLGTKRYKGFNPRSRDQMVQRFTQAGVKLQPDDQGKLSLDQNLLAFLRKTIPLVDEYLNWKESATRVSDIEKLLGSLGDDERIHCNYRQMGTDTGRLSAASPNLQQVNRSAEFRSKFVAESGKLLVVADFSQIELRVAAELSGEERMIEAYKAGRDLHTETAALVAKVSMDEVTKEMRTSAKLCNFGLLYGAGPFTLRKQAIAQYGIDMSISEAKELVNGFREAYPTLYRWQREQGEGTQKTVWTGMGRRRELHGFNDKFTTRINTQVQGTAGDVAKLAIAFIWEKLRCVSDEDAKLIAMVHDEIVLEVAENQVEHWGQELKAAMEQAGAQVCKHVPVVAEVSWGKTWADAK